MNDLPVSAALKASALTAKAAASTPEQAEMADSASAPPSGTGTFAEALQKELEPEPQVSALVPGMALHNEDPAAGAQAPVDVNPAQAAATIDATLAMLLHAQQGAASAQPASLAAPVLLGGPPSQEASLARAGGVELGPVAAAPRKGPHEWAAVASWATQPLQTERPRTFASQLMEFSTSVHGAATPSPPAQEFRFEGSSETSQPPSLGPPGAPVQESSRQQGPTVAQAQLHARFGDAHWDQGLGERMMWMASQRQQVAQLQLNPPELGPLTVTLTLEHGQASAQFVSAQLAVREAIEAAMPRLREMLADSGITLADVNVGAQAFQEPAQKQAHARAQPKDAPLPSPGLTLAGATTWRAGVGLVDTFA